MGTYSNKFNLVSANECQNCPEGYFCNDYNITDYTSYNCSAGKYCLERASQEIDCPAGTYRSIEQGKELADCWRCPAGHYCPAGSIAPIAC